MKAASSWRWAGAKATGTSHLRADRGCDDNGGCVIVGRQQDEALAIVVSDGAGSAAHSSIGSRLICRRFLRSAAAFFKIGGGTSSLSDETLRQWLDEIRDALTVSSLRLEVERRQLAATLVGCLVDDDGAVFVHIGDGAGVFRMADTSAWRVATWPSTGEYASTTYFVTDDPEPRLVVTRIEGKIDHVAVFTDGLERLILDFTNRVAHRPFFDGIFAPFAAGRRRDRVLSKNIERFLDSPKICERTDDDKTLVLARRAAA